MMKIDNGLFIKHLARSAFRAFSSALGRKHVRGIPLMGWNDMDLNTQNAWYMAVYRGVDCINGEDSLSWTTLAQLLYESYVERLGQSSMSFDDQYPEVREAWIAVAKHIANLMDLEDAEPWDLAEHEDHWFNYSEKQLAKEIG